MGKKNRRSGSSKVPTSASAGLSRSGDANDSKGMKSGKCHRYQQCLTGIVCLTGIGLLVDIYLMGNASNNHSHPLTMELREPNLETILRERTTMLAPVESIRTHLVTFNRTFPDDGRLDDAMNPNRTEEAADTAIEEEAIETPQQRATALRNRCRKLGRFYDELRELNKGNFGYVLPDHKLSFCYVRGAASTSFKNAIRELAFSRSRMSALDFFNSIILPGESGKAKDIGEGGKRIIVVRHPFHRLLSAYRRFIRTDSSSYVNLTNAIMFADPKKQRTLFDTPTFKEFVRYIIQLSPQQLVGIGEHFRPYWIHCRVCDRQYDYVIRMEDFTDEAVATFLWSDLGVMDGEIFGRAFATSRVQDTNKGFFESQTGKLMESYFWALTRQEVEALYKQYQLDFDLFGYDYTKYLTYAEAEKTGENE